MNMMNACTVGEDSPYFNHTPLVELSSQTRLKLSSLNGIKILRSEDGYERDWRGIATLSKQKNFCDAINTGNPIEKVIEFWIKHEPQTAKIGYLQQYLGIIDRWDVCDDIQEYIKSDTNAFNLRKQREALKAQTTQNFNGLESYSEQIRPITDEDVDCLRNRLPLPQYDAFVLYAEADIESATEIMQRLENSNYNLKLYLKDRDMLAGIRFEHVELIKLIEERCKHLIVLITEDFLRSPENAFLVNYTQALQIQNNVRKIIPIVYSPNMAIPKTLKIYSPLKYNGHSLFNFWDKLAKSLYKIEDHTIYYSVKTPMPTAPPEDAIDASNDIQKNCCNAKVVDTIREYDCESYCYQKIEAEGSMVDLSTKVNNQKIKTTPDLLTKSTPNLSANPTGVKRVKNTIKDLLKKIKKDETKREGKVKTKSDEKGKKKKKEKNLTPSIVL